MNTNNGVTYQGMFNTTDVNADSINTDDVTCDTLEVLNTATIYNLTITNNLTINSIITLLTQLILSGTANTNKFVIYMPDGVTKLLQVDTSTGNVLMPDIPIYY